MQDNEKSNPPLPPLACGSNSTVSSLLGNVWGEDGLGPLTVGARPEPGRSQAGARPERRRETPSKEETVELLTHANGGVSGNGVSH